MAGASEGPGTERAAKPMRKEFFLSFASRLTPVNQDYDQFVLREDAPGHFRLCVEMTGIFSGERPWYVTADQMKATYWRSGREGMVHYWQECTEEPGTFQQDQARARELVPVFMDYMRQTDDPPKS